MALRKTVDFKGMTVNSAYIRVSGVSILAGNARITFGVSVMVDRGADAFDTTYENCGYDLEGGNPVRQAYEHLKTLDKYTGAEDC